MKQCKFCKEFFEENAKFCPYCGRVVIDQNTSSANSFLYFLSYLVFILLVLIFSIVYLKQCSNANYAKETLWTAMKSLT